MLRPLAVVACAALALVSAVASANAQAPSPRLALVIGNSNYRSVTPLPNPVNDAKAVAAELRTASFDVTEALDLGQSDMRRAIRAFADKVARKGADTVALVFYAGHGVQVDGENFLVPVDARIEREADIPIEAVRLADLMNALAAVPSRMRIVILDACRNNPFSTAKQTKGLAIVDAPTGSIVAYSTAPGTEATDGSGADSPYTTAFLEVAKEPHLQIEQLFKQVRLKVHQATNGQQTPWESSSLTSDFSFFPANEAAPASNPAVAAVMSAAPVAAGRQATPQIAAAQPTALPSTQRSASTAAQPITQAAAQSTAPSGSEAAPTTFAAAAPSTAAPVPPVPAIPAPASYAPPPPVAVADMRMLSPDDAYDLAIEEDTVAAYEEFLLVYPYDPRADWIRAALALRVDAIAWRYAVLVNTPAAYADYAARYPGGLYVGEAMRLKLRPRLRPLDAVIAPRVVVAPPAPRIALPLIQMRRPAGAPIVLPVVLSRPTRFDRARFAPNPVPSPRIPGGNPGLAPRFNNLNNNAAVFPPGHNPQFNRQFANPPVANAAPNGPPVGPALRPANPQFRRAMQRAQLGPRPKLPPKCNGKRCGR